MRLGFWGRLQEYLRERVSARSDTGSGDAAAALELRLRGEAHLRRMLGSGAAFREGQWEAVEAVIARRERVLVVQRTGWGKSMVYFLATRLLREDGAGPTLLISPLLSLMRNQIASAARIGVRAYSFNSDNRDEWAAVEAALDRDECDILLVSPERLAMGHFLSRMLSRRSWRIGMLAVDEAHCISDWGHDFRPDYRRIGPILRALPPATAVLATTATANDRVVADVVEQLGPELRVVRGALARSSLRLHVIGPMSEVERLAWLADQVPRLPGSGIIYCLTVADCRRVSDWLLSRGIAAPPYYSALEEYRTEREALLLGNRVKALVATVALGMGFDKPDLSFVIHYQSPASIVAYYEQVGRAGRAINGATVALLHGEEDAATHDYFVRAAFPDASEMNAVLEALETAAGAGPALAEGELLARVNISPARMERILKLLDIDGAVVWDRSRYRRTPVPWSPDRERVEQITGRRRHELARMGAYLSHAGCLMTFLTRELDDPSGSDCGVCGNCSAERLPDSAPAALVHEAAQFLRCDDRVIEPRRRWPESGSVGPEGALLLPNEPGRALCLYGDGGWGRAVIDGKYRHGRYGEPLVTACVELIRERWRPSPMPEWVTAVPSLRHPDLVPDFAARLARLLGLPFHPVLTQVRATAEQKEMNNSAQQVRNISGAFRVTGSCPPGPVLLVDDVVDSRWTLTFAGHLIRGAGAGPVYPLALAESAGSSGLA